jgi:hypothetical protein
MIWRWAGIAMGAGLLVATACSKDHVADGEKCESEDDCFPRSTCVGHSGLFSSYSRCEPCPVAGKSEKECPPNLYFDIQPADQDVAAGPLRLNGTVIGALDEVENITWSFGDGQVSQGVSASVDHVFPVFGRYDVKATVKTANGEQGTGSATIRVCRQACPPKTCNVAGWCDPPLLLKGELHPFALAGDELLVTGFEGAFYRCGRAGCNDQPSLVDVAQGFDIAVAGTRVAWITANGRIFTCALPSCSPDAIIAEPSGGTVHGIATNGARVWFFRQSYDDARNGVSTLVSCPIGSPCTTPTIHATTTRPGRLWLDGEFVLSHRDDRIERVRRDGSGTAPMEVLTAVPPDYGAVYATLPGVILHRAIRGGRPVLVACASGSCDLITAPTVLDADVSVVAASPTRIFYIDKAKVMSAPLAGGAAPSVVFEAAQPLWGSLVVDGNGVFTYVNGGVARLE